jgi:hypothetical protein
MIKDRGQQNPDLPMRQLAAIAPQKKRRSNITAAAPSAAKMVAHDAFLSVLAIALDEERFDLAARQLDRSWLLKPSNNGRRSSTTDFTAFREHLKSLEHRNQRLDLRRISVHADLIKDAHNHGALPNFESIMQADLVCYIRGQSLGEYYGWYPETLVYASDRRTPFAVFARSESIEYLGLLLPVLGASDLAAFQNLITRTDSSQRNSSLFNREGLPMRYVANLEHLGTKP